MAQDQINQRPATRPGKKKGFFQRLKEIISGAGKKAKDTVSDVVKKDKSPNPNAIEHANEHSILKRQQFPGNYRPDGNKIHPLDLGNDTLHSWK